jgi:hypothetical protein
MPTVVVPDASANAFKRLSLLNDVSHRAAARGFYLFLFKTSSAVLTTAAVLYVVLYGDLSTPPKDPRDVLQAGSYDKTKARRQEDEKTRQTKHLKTRRKKTCDNDSGDVADAGHVGCADRQFEYDHERSYGKYACPI